MFIKGKNQDFKLRSIWLQACALSIRYALGLANKQILGLLVRDQIQVLTLSLISYVTYIVFFNYKVGIVCNLPWSISVGA